MKTVTFKFVETAEPDVEDNEYQVFIDDVESKEYSIQAGVFERYYVANKYMFEDGHIIGVLELATTKSLLSAKSVIIAEINKN